MLGFMHRLAYSAGRTLRHKPAAVVTSARRAGTTTALEALEKVPQYFEMPLISSTYWPMVHGSNAAQVAEDAEGLQIMRNLGAILEAAGSSLENLVKTTVFLVDLADFAAMNEVYANHVGERPPARATIGIAQLPSGARVEIEAIAYV